MPSLSSSLRGFFQRYTFASGYAAGNRDGTKRLCESVIHEGGWLMHVFLDPADNLTNPFGVLEKFLRNLNIHAEQFELPEVVVQTVGNAESDATHPHRYTLKFLPSTKAANEAMDDLLLAEGGLRHNNDLSSLFGVIMELPDTKDDLTTDTQVAAVLTNSLYHSAMLLHEIGFAYVGTTFYICLRGSITRKDFKLDYDMFTTDEGFARAKARAAEYTAMCIAKMPSGATAVRITGHSLGGLLACFVAQNLAPVLRKCADRKLLLYNPFFGIGTPIVGSVTAEAAFCDLCV